MKNYILLFAIIISFASHAQVSPNHPRIFIDSTMMDTLQSRRIRNTIEWQKMSTWVEYMKPNTIPQIFAQYEGQHYAFGFMLAYWARRDTVYRNKAVEIFKAYWATKTDASINRDSGFDSRGMMADCAICCRCWYFFYQQHMRKQLANYEKLNN